MRVVGKQHQRSQACGTDGVAFGHGLGGVAHGVQRVGDVPHAAGQFGHFGDAARVVGDGAISIQGHHNAGHAQHGHGSHGNAVQTSQCVGGPNGQADKHHRPGGGAHRHPQTGNDVGAMPRGRGLRDVLHGRVLRAGVELSDPNQRGRQHQADGTSAKQLHLCAGTTQGVVGHQPSGDEEKRHQRKGPGDGQAFVERGHHVGHARRGFHKEAAHDGGNDRHAAQGQWVQHRLTRGGRHQQGAQHHGGDQGHGIGLKQVSSHASAVAHVVAHVVGDHGGVARVIFGDAGFNFANQVGPHIGAFGEDAPAQTRKNRDQRGAKGKADQRVEQMGQVLVGGQVAVAHQKPIKAGDAQQAQSNDQHAGDGAASEGHVQCRANPVGRGLCRAHVGFDRHVHADEAASTRQNRPNDKADGGDTVQKEPHQNGQHHAHDGDGFVLSSQVSGGTCLNSGRNFLHPGIAGILGKDPPSCPNAVSHGNQATNERQYER